MLPSVLQILHLEDDPLDAELVERALAAGSFVFEVTLVQSCADFAVALQQVDYDVILSDYNLPDGDGIKAFKLAQQKVPEIPFVLVTGALGEELAIETIKLGVHDYVLKNNLARLAATVPKVIENARERWEKKLALEELRRSEERFDLAVKGSGAGLWDWPNPSADEMWWSARVFELFGLENEEIAATQQSLLARIHPDDAEGYRQAVREHLDKGKDLDIEFRVLRPDNQVCWLRTGGKAVWDSTGRPTRMAGYIKDVTDYKSAEEERRKLEEQLRQSQKMEALGTLSSGIAHDFNNILASIVGYSSLLEKQLSSGSREHQDLQEIQKAAERAKQLVRRILTFSRNSEHEKAPVQLDMVIDETLQLLRPSLPKSVQVETNLAAAGECIYSDKTLIHQVLMNLCVNAHHAMPNGGVLSLTLDRVQLAKSECLGLPGGDYLKLNVRDTGTGIAPEIMDNIFDPYFTTKDVDTGTGLGLSIVNGIVKDLNGGIKVESVQGQGTSFSLYFPCECAPPVEQARVLEQSDLKGSGHILFVDDDPALVRVNTAFLEDLGYRVSGFSDSMAALQALRTDISRYALLVTDLMMPKMTGVELAQKIYQFAPDFPVFLCSGRYHSLEPEEIATTNIRQIFLKTELFSQLPTELMGLKKAG